ncbi:esterase [Bacillus sp. M6-12]|nr:esterase [Bacillus sp. M6-12]
MLEIFPIHMKEFNQDRTIRVYTPQNYREAEKRYPVLYMHDGQNVFRDESAVGGGVSLGLENFLDETKLEIIVVGIDLNTAGQERVNEYCPWKNGEYSTKLGGDRTLGGRGEAYLNFITDELKPFIDKQYRTLPDQTSMAGISLGGLITSFAACKYPEIFAKVAVFSSAFWRNQEDIENLIRRSDLSSIERFYLDCGTVEAREDTYINNEFLSSNKAVYELLKERIINTRFDIIEDAEHHYNFFRQRVPEVFKFLYPELTGDFKH